MAPQANSSSSGAVLISIVCTYVLTAISIASVAFHFKVFIGTRKTPVLEDYLLLAAFALALLLVAQITWALIDGDGHAQQQSGFVLLAQSLLVSEVLWAFVTTFVRFSVLIFTYKLLRIFIGNMMTRAAFVLLLFLSTLYGIAACLITLLICRPIRASWDARAQASCGNQSAALAGLEIGGLLVTLLVVLFPVLLVPHLQPSKTSKITFLLLIITGLWIAAITGLRITALRTTNKVERPYNQSSLGLLSTAGALLHIIHCCALRHSGPRTLTASDLKITQDGAGDTKAS